MEPEKVRAPNIRDVAALAGVSYQTVSRVLNDSPSIKASTRQRVLDVISEIGYRPNQAARALVTARPNERWTSAPSSSSRVAKWR